MKSTFTIHKCTDPVTVALFIKRLGVMHKRLTQLWTWKKYNENIGWSVWMTDAFRVIGVCQSRPEIRLKPGESLVQVALPWSGSGQDLRLYVDAYMRRHRRLHAAATKRSK